MQNEHKLKRAVLRYATKKMPTELRKKAMEKTNNKVLKNEIHPSPSFIFQNGKNQIYN